MPREQTLLFVSHNQHKVQEMKRIFPSTVRLLGLDDIGWTEEIPEPYETFEENAKGKATYVFERTGMPCFAEDSGLEVDALDGRPGVYSARYAGEQKSSIANLQKVLLELEGQANRTARFVAVIAYADGRDHITCFRGQVEGSIAWTMAGEGGFGYDPVFIPAGFDQTFSQLPPSLKDRMSHRAKAIAMFLEYLS